MICYIKEIFLPSRARKFGDNVPNRVKSNKHCIYISLFLFKTAHAFHKQKKKVHHMSEKTGAAQYKYPRKPNGKTAS